MTNRQTWDVKREYLGIGHWFNKPIQMVLGEA